MDLDDLRKELSQIFQGKVLIAGIGNTLRSDDGFGPELINRLSGKINAECLDLGLAPENYIGKIVKLNPDIILFMDALSMDEPVATLRLIPESQIPHYGFSTHNMSPKLMIENIKSQINAKIFMLGIQPKNLEFGEEISQEILEKLNFLENIFIRLRRKPRVCPWGSIKTLGKDETQK